MLDYVGNDCRVVAPVNGANRVEVAQVDVLDDTTAGRRRGDFEMRRRPNLHWALSQRLRAYDVACRYVVKLNVWVIEADVWDFVLAFGRLYGYCGRLFEYAGQTGQMKQQDYD